MTAKPISERRLVFLVGAVQFVNVLDFMMVMPLGPDFAQALAIPVSQLGLVGGIYTAAAAISGFAGAFFLDRFDRRKALALALLGLVLATAAGGLATGLTTMLLARLFAGAFGGPATSVALAMIADVVPPERRGRAMGAVMGAFSVASVLGVPAGLRLSRMGGWSLPFFVVAGLGFLVVATAIALLPPMHGHVERAKHAPRPTPAMEAEALARRPAALLALLSTAVVMLGTFAIVPNLAAYLLYNLDYPRAGLESLYMVGGAVTFATMRLSGLLVDRVGAARVAGLGTALFAVVLVLLFLTPSLRLPVMVLFVAFMASGTFRMVPMQALSSRVPPAPTRARFMSAQSAVQHMAAALGAMLSAWFLTTAPDDSLRGMDKVAMFALTLALLLPFLLAMAERRVRRIESDAAAANAATAPAAE